MLRRILTRYWSPMLVVILVLCSLTLSGCGISVASGLKSYVDTEAGYAFLYPNGWLPVKAGGIQVAFHDLIEPTENVSVIISPAPGKKTLEDLGGPDDVGSRLAEKAIAPPDSGRKADLVTATVRKTNDKTYYILEYAVKLADQDRHHLASVVVSRGKLYTFNASTSEQRWTKAEKMLRTVVNSFSAY